MKKNKKIAAIFVAICLLFVSCVSVSGEGLNLVYLGEKPSSITGPIAGDVNSDDTVDLKDVLTYRKHLAKFEITFDDSVADINMDKCVDMKDVLSCRKTVLFSFAYSGSTRSWPIYGDKIEEIEIGFVEGGPLYCCVVNSLNELKEIFDRGVNIDDEYPVKKDIPEKYTQDFFENNSLMVIPYIECAPFAYDVFYAEEYKTAVLYLTYSYGVEPWTITTLLLVKIPKEYGTSIQQTIAMARYPELVYEEDPMNPKVIYSPWRYEPKLY